jgi:tetratricopeptide (TPR) repeat protein
MADQVSFALASLELDAKDFPNVAKMAEVFEGRFPDSTYLDRFQYIRAWSLFQMGKYKDALDLCNKIAAAKYSKAGGGAGWSEDRYNAMHMAGKIYHAERTLDKAFEEYTKVKDRFTDAALAIDYFEETGLEIPEVTVIRSGKPAALKIRHKNLSGMEIRAYDVDLLTLYLAERDLTRITSVNLSGIRPSFDPMTIDFGDKEKYDWKEEEIQLPLKEDGAYLLMIKGVLAEGKTGQIDRSAMVLRSDLEIDVQEDSATGRVRVNVTDLSGVFIAQAEVKVIGSRDSEFKGGETDLRGVFEAQGVHGTSGVVVRKGAQFAFFRGESALMPPQGPVGAPQKAQPSPALQDEQGGLYNVKNQFKDDNTAQIKNLDYLGQQRQEQRAVQSVFE